MLLYNDRVQMYGFASQILLCKSAELAGCGSRGGAASLHVAMGVTHRILPSDAKELAQIISSCRLVRGAPSLFGRNFRNPGLIRLPVRARGWTTCLCSECADSGKVTDILFEARGAQILILQYSRDNSLRKYPKPSPCANSGKVTDSLFEAWVLNSIPHEPKPSPGIFYSIWVFVARR